MKDWAGGLGLLAEPMGLEAGGAAVAGGGGAVGAGAVDGAEPPPLNAAAAPPPARPARARPVRVIGSMWQRPKGSSWGFMRPFFLGSRGCIRSRRQDGGDDHHLHPGYGPAVHRK